MCRGSGKLVINAQRHIWIVEVSSGMDRLTRSRDGGALPKMLGGAAGCHPPVSPGTRHYPRSWGQLEDSHSRIDPRGGWRECEMLVRRDVAEPQTALPAWAQHSGQVPP